MQARERKCVKNCKIINFNSLTLDVNNPKVIIWNWLNNQSMFDVWLSSMYICLSNDGNLKGKYQNGISISSFDDKLKLIWRDLCGFETV